MHAHSRTAFRFIEALAVIVVLAISRSEAVGF